MPPEPGGVAEGITIGDLCGTLGFLALAGLTTWLSFRGLFRNRQDFAECFGEMCTGGLTATLRGRLRKNLDGTIRFVIWVFLTGIGLLISAGIVAWISSVLSPAH